MKTAYAAALVTCSRMLAWVVVNHAGRLANLSFREARITIGYRTRIRFRRRKKIAGDDPSRDITSRPGKPVRSSGEQREHRIGAHMRRREQDTTTLAARLHQSGQHG